MSATTLHVNNAVVMSKIYHVMTRENQGQTFASNLIGSVQHPLKLSSFHVHVNSDFHNIILKG